MSDSGKREESGEAKAGARRRVPRWVVWVGGVTLIAVGVAAAVVAYVLHNAEPILRRRVIASLQERFRAPVELDGLHISLLKGLEVSGEGLRIFGPAAMGEADAVAGNGAPMLAVKTFEFRTGLHELFEPVMRVRAVHVEGMDLRIPPRQAHEPGAATDVGKKVGKARLSIVVDEIVCSGMTLTIETNRPGKQPLVFDIREVTLHDVGPGKATPFEAQLTNARPVGEIHSTGHFGPWQQEEPRDTALDGDYTFTNADLGTIKGISGTLASAGKFGGTLGEIGVTGTTDTLDFALDVSDHPVDLKTEFDAMVDGTSGDTKLNHVHATWLHTALDVTGVVMRASDVPGSEGMPGHLIDLSVTGSQARVEDLLTLAVKTRPPLMLGGLALRAHLRILPGHASVTERMRLQGTFAIHGATFTNPKWQGTVDSMSERASGNPAAANAAAANAAAAKRVSSEMSGEFNLANAVLELPKLSYQTPGAQVNLTGKYTLDGKTVEFDGTVRTQATASQMLTGWKSLLAMPLDKLLQKNGAGVEVPITIRGTKSDAKVSVDMNKLGASLFSRHKDEPAGKGQKP